MQDNYLITRLENAGFKYVGRLGVILGDHFPAVVAEIEVSSGILDYIVALKEMPDAIPANSSEYGEFIFACESRSSNQLNDFYHPAWATLYRSMGTNWFSSLLRGVVLKPQGRSWIQLTGPAVYDPPQIREKSKKAPSFKSRKHRMCTSRLATRLLYKGDSIKFGSKEHAIEANATAIFPSMRSKYRFKVSKLLEKFEKRSTWLNVDLDKFCAGDSVVPRRVVLNVTMIALKQCIPKELIGPNIIPFRDGVREWISMGRYESTSLNFFVKGWKSRGLVWLGQSNNAAHHQMTQRMLLHLIEWLFSVVVPRIVKRFFHIAQQSNHAGGCYYYRKDLWHKRYNQQIKELSKQLEPVTEHPMAPFNTPARIHLVLKPNGETRPVINLSHLKNALGPSRLVLDFLTLASPCRLRSLSDFLPRLVRFQRQHFGKRFYCVKVDIAKCFDSIDTDKLIYVLKSRLANKAFQAYNFWDERRGRKVTILASNGKYELPETATNSVLRHYSTETISGSTVLQTISVLLKQLLIQGGSVALQKSSGIPQGSSASNALCNFALDHILRSAFGEYITDQNSLLLHYVDDILFVSTQEQTACRFIRRMKEGFPEFNVFIQPKKTECNFSGENREMNLIYLGTCFNAATLDVLPLKLPPFKVRTEHPEWWIRRRLEGTINLRFASQFHSFDRHNVILSDKNIKFFATAIGRAMAVRMHYLGANMSLRKKLFDQLLAKSLKLYSRCGGRNKPLFISVCISEYRKRSKRYI
ncbi:Telomerase reverse transcriptase [Wickerhamiella sorbophila]|uniref:Telomerase reverse transcriptase n=1 Tax=Wickerhamiella sorbophila TaxID=45607 RepID=A0A2T0FHL3_9ASCO|nr:Telomerase reverse transcriptase [Wickerhamiella sorbophila]PRT54466.1 Telomerase reverse transcriptase [Wickerhamiella sorbophila]